MTEDRLWQILCERTPQFKGDPATEVTLKLRGLRRLVSVAFQAGVDSAPTPRREMDVFESIFRGFTRR